MSFLDTVNKARQYDQAQAMAHAQQMQQAQDNLGLAYSQGKIDSAAELNALMQEANRQAMQDPRMYEAREYQVGEYIYPPMSAMDRAIASSNEVLPSPGTGLAGLGVRR